MDEEKVRKQAKELLDKFARALEGIKTEEVSVEREQDRRNEGKEAVKIDRDIMFKNAPKTKGDCIESEKGAWV